MFGTLSIKNYQLKIIDRLPFQEINSIPQAIKEFLSGEISGFETDTFSLDNFQRKINAKSESFTQQQREKLFSALKKQTFERNSSPLQVKNLHSLLDEKTFTITTGHQLNLFTGPVFFIYKILQTIKTAEFLKNHFPEKNFVPIFWMATEDHDFEEINHFRTENHFYEINGKKGGAVGRIEIQDSSFISEFEQEFKDSVFGTELILLMKEAYKKGNSLAEATRNIVDRLFAEYGLMIIDGDDQLLKSDMKEIFKNEIFEKSLYKNSEKQVENLREKYGKVQVNPREINLFYLSKTRNRIDPDGENFVIDDTEKIFSATEIIKELEKNPEKFSPNALLRPVYQEKILPNIAYIGGNAEIMYWLELKNHFEKLNLVFPVLIPRNSMLFVSEKNIRKIEKNQLHIKDFFKDFQNLMNSVLIANNEISKQLEEKQKLIETNFEELKQVAEITDITFGNLVKSEEKRQLKSYEKMRKRLIRAEKIKQNEKVERLEKLFLQIHPGKNWQERVFNFSVFYADFGKQWLETCFKEMDVQKSELIVMQY